MKNSLIIFSLIFTVSCGLFTNHEREIINPEIASNWNYEQYDDLITKNQKSLAAIKYQNFFLNEELVKVIDLALEHNRDLKIASLKVQAAQDYYRVKRADLFPKISSNFDASRQKVSSNSLNRFGANFAGGNSFIVNNYQANLATASFELDLFNKLKYINEAAFNDFLSQVENKNAIRISLIANAANSYINAAISEEISQLSVEFLKIEEQKYSLVAAKYKNGLILQNEKLAASNRLKNTATNHENLVKIAKQDKNHLVNLLGLENDNKIKFINFEQLKVNEKSFFNLSSDILLTRPDILAAQYQLYMADANIKIARASYFPSISLTGNYGFASNKFSNLISTDNSGGWNVGAGINIPIFSGFKNSANLAQKKAQRKIAVENYQKTIQAAFKEVADLLATRKYQKSNFDNSKNIYQASSKIFKQEYKFFQNGVKDKLAFLTAHQDFIVKQIELINSKKEMLNNYINLYKAFGAGMVEQEVTATEKLTT